MLRTMALCKTFVVAGWLACVVVPLALAEGSSSLTMPTLSQVAKLVPHGDGVPGDPEDWFGQSIALDGDTAVVGAPRADGGGTATVFARWGTHWSEQAKLRSGDERPDEWFGGSVAISGDTVVVGARWDDTAAGQDAGSAFVFVRSGTIWRQQAKLVATDAAAGDQFGASVAISGDTIVIGAPFDTTTVGALAAGSAYVFVRSGTAWSQQAKLVAGDGAAGDRFGLAVSIADGTLVVGSPFDDAAVGDAGSAYVFVRSGTSWNQQAKLLAAEGTHVANFGTSVALAADTLVVGASSEHASPAYATGAAFVFVRGRTLWSQQQQLSASDGAQGDIFGASVSIAGDRVVVGAPAADTKWEGAGAAYVFVRSGVTWSEQQKLVASDGAPFDEFGHAVALSGATALAGTPTHDTSAGDDAGVVYAFAQTGATWSEQQELTPSDDAAGDGFGWAVSLSGDSLAVAAPSDVTAASPFPGSATVFVSSASGWMEQQKLTALDASLYDRFAESLALAGNTLVVGAPGAADEAGVAYVYERSGPLWSARPKLIASDAAAGAYFGYAVAASGDTLVIGAPHADAGSADVGAAYVFVRSGTTWSEQQKLTGSDTAAGTGFGVSVSIAGDTVVVGAPYAGESEAGAAYVFVRTGATWSEQQKLAASDATVLGYFGRSVSVSGDTLVVGAPIADTPAGMDVGSAYVFARTGIVWTEQQKLWLSDGVWGNEFGYAVALDGNTLAVGSNGRDTLGGFSAGAAYVFTRSGSMWGLQSRLVARDGAAWDHLGWALSLSNGRLAVGACADDTAAGPDSGSVYVFEPKLKGDFDRDLHTDLVFRNEAGAYHETWLMDGVVRHDTRRIEPDLADPAWQLGGVDDFNADGQDDLVLWNALTGAVEFWFMYGAKGEAVPLTGALPLSTDWRLTASGDFNADGNPDLVWRNDISQKIVIWTMQATVKAGNIVPSPSQAAYANWEIVAALDYNGDGARDFVWYNRDSGKVVLWFMDANVVRLSGQFTKPPDAGDHNWKVLAGGDYGIGAWGWAGTNDLVWRNATSGRIVVWYMDRAGNRTSGTFTTPDAPGPNPLDWTLAGPR